MNVEKMKLSDSGEESSGKSREVWMFSGNQRCYFFQPDNATSILTDDDLLRQIVSGKISGVLNARLEQRGIKHEWVQSTEEACVKPLLFMIDFTQKCQNKCVYCFRKLNRSQHISRTQLTHILNYIASYCTENAVRNISIQPWGGEPLLEWENVKYMQDYLSEKNIATRIVIETNGMAITSQMAKEICERDILVGISLDGPEKIHNLHRPLYNKDDSSSFKKTIHGYELLREAGYKNHIGMVCVVTKASLPYLEEILSFFAEELKVLRVKINIIKESEQLQKKDLALNEEDIVEFNRKLCNSILSINQKGIAFGESGVVERLHNLLDCKIVNLCSSRGCQGAKRIISFRMDGGIFPCDQIDTSDYCLGTIGQDDPLMELINKQVHNPFYQSAELVECVECAWQIFCKGGCTTMRLLKKTRLDEAECVRNKTIYPMLIELILNHPQLIASITNNEITIA